MVRSSFPRPLDDKVAALVARLDANQREAFEERAAILEFDAQQPRIEAERLALLDILVRLGFPDHPRVVVLEVRISQATHWVLAVDEISARHRLTELGGSVIASLDLSEVLRSQFGGFARLARWS